MIKITDSYFDTIYNDKILAELEKKFGVFQQYHTKFTVSTENMQRLMGKMRRKRRRGEVVMVIPNEAGNIWLHTKAFYPEGVFRLMTGGLEPDEKPHRALRREVYEETGFEIEIERCLAVLTYTLTDGEGYVPFASYAFLTTPTKGIPQPTDPNEAITEFLAVSPESLLDTAQQLSAVNGEFSEWGKFRAIAHKVVAEQLYTK